MCQQCADALEKYWSHVPADVQEEVLWECTAFPADGEIVARQLKEAYEQSGGDAARAIATAHEEMDAAMKEYQNAKLQQGDSGRQPDTRSTDELPTLPDPRN